MGNKKLLGIVPRKSNDTKVINNGVNQTDTRKY